MGCFIVVLQNPSFGLRGLSSEKGSEKGSEKTSEQIFAMIGPDPTISAKELSLSLGISSRAVEKWISQLKAQGRLKRIGSARGGRWETVQ
jgi:ATP-dependent DNA helicase RecG